MVEQTEQRMRERIAEGDRAAENRVQAGEEEAAEILADARAEADRVLAGAREQSSKSVADATSEALAIIGRAQENADKVLSEANAEAAREVSEAQQRARDLLRGARTSASDIRTEGLEIVGNLREMGDSLRANAERLLRDVQMIHSRMIAEIDRADGGLGASSSRGPASAPSHSSEAERRRRGSAETSSTGEVLDVPEFIPPG